MKAATSGPITKEQLSALSSRARGVIRRLGVDTWEGMGRVTESDLRGVKHYGGPMTVEELAAWLGRNGIELALVDGPGYRPKMTVRATLNALEERVARLESRLQGGG
jgi:hypothetical protein